MHVTQLNLIICIFGKEIIGMGPYCGWDKDCKQHSKLCTWFFYINVALTLIGYRKPPKLDYCFITSTSLVPVGLGFSITGLRNESEAARNTASSCLEHTQIINRRCRLHKWAWQLKVWMRTKRTKVWTLLPGLPHINTIYSRTSSLVHPWVKHKNSKHT